MQFEIVITDNPLPEDRVAILALLVAYNNSHAGPAGFQALTILLRDPVDAKTIGGLWGRSVYDWLYIELLAVPEPLHGKDIGSALMRRAETIAMERGCVGVWLDTYGFQARGFYEKLGYEIFGVLDDHPRGSQRFFMRKLLETATR